MKLLRDPETRMDQRIGIPVTVVVGADGRIAAVDLGFSESPKWQRVLSGLVQNADQ